MEHQRILVIDNGSYKCRIGYNDSDKPLLEFRNLVAKPRKDKKKEVPATVNENIFQIGDEIDVDAMRLLVKNQFEKNVVTHPTYQEHIFDYIFGKLATDDNWKPQIVLITEPLANPNYCRQTMNELLFECYGISSVCYGIDSVLSWQHNRQTKEENSLVINFGYHTTHVVPILKGQLQHDKVRRLNLGGYQMISYLYRLLQMKYPAHLNAISWTRMEDIFHNHSFVALDYLEELRKWDNLDYYNSNVKKIQLPFAQPVAFNPLAAEEKLKKRKELTKRLIEANQKRLREKKGEEWSPDVVSLPPINPSLSTRGSKFKPPSDVPLEDWLKDIKRKHMNILEKKSNRNKRRQEMVKRHTVASQERMRIISLLASNEKGSDEFGKDDKDWDVYKKISHENESDSDAENEKLFEYDNIMKYHQAAMDKDIQSIENTAELYQLHVGVESLRAPELLFQPSMIGLAETGLAELLNFVFHSFNSKDQQLLADNVFLTGGCSQLPGLKDRLLKELQEMRPFKSSFSIKESKNPLIDAWLGAKDFSNSSDFSHFLTTQSDYLEKVASRRTILIWCLLNMFLRPKVFVCQSYINISKRLLSDEFRKVLNTRLEPPAGINSNQLQLAVVSKNLNALNLDLFVNNLNQYEDRRSAVLDLLANIRATKNARSCLDSTYFAVVRHLLDNSSLQEMVPVLMDRPQFGIFLDNFTGFAVTHALHNEKEYIMALPLSLKLVLLDELDSTFIQIFCAKACVATLKKDLTAEPTSDENTTPPAPPPPKGKVQEKKIRVRFLRNPVETNINHEMGKALLKIASKVFAGSVKDNTSILAYVLSENYLELKNLLQSNSCEINVDVADMCKELLSRSSQPDFAVEFENLTAKNSSDKSFEEILNALLTEAAGKEETLLAEKQLQLLPSWQQMREEKKLVIENEIREKERMENIKKVTNDISTKRELLWFFEQEDKLDLDIYKKRVFYPKRWFGKKKKPRVVDEHYVPPQIRNIK